MKDVSNLALHLKKKYNIPEDHYLELRNEEATRQGIISSFRNHFGQLKEGDLGVFHFSGHGSNEPTSPDFAFAKYDYLYGKNEVLVCYNSHDKDIYNIADKELRWLISEIQYPVKAAERNIPFLCIFDCCHSGSMLRANSLLKKRMDSSIYKTRPLNAYLEGQYAMEENRSLTGEILLPPVDYISMTACSPTEYAYESDSGGGIFTNALINALQTHPSDGFSYKELYLAVRDNIKLQTKNKQTPYFEYTGKVNPNCLFLKVGQVEQSMFPILKYHSGEWKVFLGTIHGMEQDYLLNSQFPVFESSDLNICLTYGIINEVFLETTSISLKNEHILERSKSYIIAISPQVLPIRFTPLDNKEAFMSTLEKEFFKDLSTHQFLLTSIATYEVQITKNTYLIYSQTAKTVKFLYGVTLNHQLAISLLFQNLKKIVKWEQINQLSTSKENELNPKDIDFKFIYENYNNKEEEFLVNPTTQEPDLNAYLNLTYYPNKGGIPYRIEVKNNTKTILWFYLIHLDRKFGISQKNENYIKNCYPGEVYKLFDSKEKNTGLGISESVTNEIIDIYLLIASKKPLNVPVIFEQSSFGDNFGKIQSSNKKVKSFQNRIKACQTREEISVESRKLSKANWVVKRLEVKVQRASNTL